MNREERGVGTEGYKGEQDARSGSSGALVVSSVFVVVWVGCSFRRGGFFFLGATSCVLRAVVISASSWSSGSLGFGGPGRVVGARSQWGVRVRHEGRGREAPLCQLCRASLRTREESAGESSPTIAPEGAGNLQRSCGARSVIQAPRHKALTTLSGTLVYEGGLFLAFE